MRVVAGVMNGRRVLCMPVSVLLKCRQGRRLRMGVNRGGKHRRGQQRGGQSQGEGQYPQWA